MVPLSGYSYCRKISIAPAFSGTCEANFACPAVNVPDLTGKAQADFDDVVFTDTDGTTLIDWYHESKILAAAKSHFRIPGTFAASQVVGYAHYGNAAASDQADEAGVFSNGFVARHGMSDAGPTNVLDSLGVNNGTQSGGVTFGAAGKVGNCLSFDGLNDFVNIGNVLNGLPGITVSCWINLITEGPQIISKWWDGSNRGWFLNSDGSGVISWHCASDTANNDSAAVASDSGAISVGTWHHIAGSWDPSNGAMRIYVDGISYGSKTLSGAVTRTNSTQLHIGNALYAGTNMAFTSGSIDQVGITNGARSPAWVAAEYMAGAGTLLVFGAEETAGGRVPSVIRYGFEEFDPASYGLEEFH